jgi:hypothetical protein
MDKEIEEAVRHLVEADQEIIDNMDGLRQDLAKDIRELADGKEDDFRVLDKLTQSEDKSVSPNFCPECGNDLRNYTRKTEPSENETPDKEKGTESEKELQELLENNPELYDTLSPLEQRVIDSLGLKP